MENIIIIVVLVLVVGSACFYIWKEKKIGKKCIGCPYSGGCASCKGCQSSLPKAKMSDGYERSLHGGKNYR